MPRLQAGRYARGHGVRTLLDEADAAPRSREPRGVAMPALRSSTPIPTPRAASSPSPATPDSTARSNVGCSPTSSVPGCRSGTARACTSRRPCCCSGSAPRTRCSCSVATTVWQGALLSLSLGLAMAGIGCAIQHDANHGAYSSRAAVNRVMGMTLDMLGASSYLWHFKHNLAHHTYTNLAGADDDINFVPFARLSPAQPRLRLHRLQQFYLWALYWFLFPKWNFVDDFKSLAQAQISGHAFPRPRGALLVQLIAGKAGVRRLGVRGPAAVPPVVGRAAVLRHDIAGPRHHAGRRVHARPLRGRGGVSRAAAGDGARCRARGRCTRSRPPSTSRAAIVC